MKVSHILPLAAVASAFVLPPEHLRELEIEDYRRSPCLERFLSEIDRFVDNSKEIFNDWSDEAVETSRNVWGKVRKSFEETLESASDEVDALSDRIFSEVNDVYEALDNVENVDTRPPHHGDDPHRKPNLTVYQLIAGSKYTTKLASLINEFDDLVEALNSSKANYTVFAPTDEVCKIRENLPSLLIPSVEFLTYRVDHAATS